jgi:ribosomal protein S18 acetylase RimI-like enzyme
MTVSYRAARVEDASALAALARETFVETFGHLYRPEDLDAFLDEHKTDAAWAKALADPQSRTRVTEDGGVLVGYCKVGLVPTLDYDCAGKRVSELKELYIRATHQGAGLAPVLMDWALEQARETASDEMILSVWSENIRAQRFYKRYGFDWIADTFFMVGNHRDDEHLYLKVMA